MVVPAFPKQCMHSKATGKQNGGQSSKLYHRAQELNVSTPSAAPSFRRIAATRQNIKDRFKTVLSLCNLHLLCLLRCVCSPLFFSPSLPLLLFACLSVSLVHLRSSQSRSFCSLNPKHLSFRSPLPIKRRMPMGSHGCSTVCASIAWVSTQVVNFGSHCFSFATKYTRMSVMDRADFSVLY